PRRRGLPRQAIQSGRSEGAAGATLMDVAACVAAMQAALADAQADLVTTLGGQIEQTSARVWRGQVLIDWEPDEQAGGCLLRPELVQRLLALHAQAEVVEDELRLRAGANVLRAQSPQHPQLVALHDR